MDAGDKNVFVCLCPSAACAAWGGAGVNVSLLPPHNQSWGKFNKLSVSTANSGPIISYSDGAVCSGKYTCI